MDDINFYLLELLKVKRVKLELLLDFRSAESEGMHYLTEALLIKYLYDILRDESSIHSLINLPQVQLCYDQDESLSGRIVYFPLFKSKVILQPTHHIPKALVDKNQTVFARFGSKNRAAINLGCCIYIMQNGIQIKTPHFNVKFKIHNGLFIRDL